MNNKKVKAAFLIVILIAALFIFLKDGHAEENKIMIEEGATIDMASVETDAGTSEIIIDVSGAVNNPSVVRLPEGSRVYEALDAAGGLCENASVVSLNRASILNDGDKIYIPTKDEEIVALESSPGQSGAININKATAELLQTIPGIGPATAEKIIEFRNSNGPFRSIEELMDVNGIGEKTFEKMREKLCI